LYPFRFKKKVFSISRKRRNLSEAGKEWEAVNKTSLGSRQRTEQGRFNVLSSYVMVEE
jgi:hypothetical protein